MKPKPFPSLNLSLARMPLGRESLTISAEAGTLAPLHGSTAKATAAALWSGLRSWRELVLENLALRQQLATVLQKRRPLIRPADRAFWVVLQCLWSRWSDVVVIVKPKTVIGWHRAGFGLYWRWLSRAGRPAGRPAVGRQVRDLIRRMASENGWGAPRIRGELSKLGLNVSERTVSRYLRPDRRRSGQRQSWITFLRNHLGGAALAWA